jgi:hypothetical protein
MTRDELDSFLHKGEEGEGGEVEEVRQPQGEGEEEGPKDVATSASSSPTINPE